MVNLEPRREREGVVHAGVGMKKLPVTARRVKKFSLVRCDGKKTTKGKGKENMLETYHGMRFVGFETSLPSIFFEIQPRLADAAKKSCHQDIGKIHFPTR